MLLCKLKLRKRKGGYPRLRNVTKNANVSGNNWGAKEKTVWKTVWKM